jgi:hypothetical protein
LHQGHGDRRGDRRSARLVEAGRIALEARLDAQDLDILVAKIQPALWYPIESHDRLLRVMV